MGPNVSCVQLIAVLEIRVFQLASNCKAEFQAYESERRHIENQLGSERALEGS